MGGANIIQQYLQAGVVDELRLHIAPVLLGQGTKLFDKETSQPLELEMMSASGTPGAAHIAWKIKK